MWKLFLDTESRHEITELKLIKFLKEHKVLTEKKQLDELYKQCIFKSKTDTSVIGETLKFPIFQQLFAKPLMLIAMENALCLIEGDQQLSNSPNGKKIKKEDMWPEMDRTSLGQTIAVVSFQHKFMNGVFTSEELEQYLKFKADAKRQRAQQRAV